MTLFSFHLVMAFFFFWVVNGKKSRKIAGELFSLTTLLLRYAILFIIISMVSQKYFQLSQFSSLFEVVNTATAKSCVLFIFLFNNLQAIVLN